MTGREERLVHLPLREYAEKTWLFCGEGSIFHDINEIIRDILEYEVKTKRNIISLSKDFTEKTGFFVKGGCVFQDLNKILKTKCDRCGRYKRKNPGWLCQRCDRLAKEQSVCFTSEIELN